MHLHIHRLQRKWVVTMEVISNNNRDSRDMDNNHSSNSQNSNNRSQ